MRGDVALQHCLSLAELIYRMVTAQNTLYSTSQELYTWFAICCGQEMGSFSHILQGYITGTGAIMRLPQYHEVTLKNMGKWILWNQ